MATNSASSDIEKSDVNVNVKEVQRGEYMIDSKAEKRLVRKLDLLIMPSLALAYLVTSLDRANAGNARVAGLIEDLNMRPNDFNIGTCLFYVAYILCDVPASILIRKYGFKWIPRSIIAFGIITIGCGFLRNRAEFIFIRTLLGAAESAVLPGNAAILARYYRREEITTRIGFFLYTAAYLSGAFGGLLASGFLKAKDVGMVHGWRHIFVWEGVITCAVGILLCFTYPTDPADTKMLNEEERELAIARLNQGQLNGATTDRDEKFSLKETLKIISHPQIMVATFFFICNNVTVQGLNSFLPTIIRLNYPGVTTIKVQLLSVPPNVFAWGWATLMAWVAMRFQQHALVAMLGGLFSTVGYAIWVATDATYVKTRYAAVFLNCGSGYYGPLILAWAMSNAKSDKIRALTGAVVSGLGAIGSVISPWTYLASTAASGYKPGNSLNLSLSITVVVGVAMMRLFQMRLNAKSGPGDFKWIY